MKTAKEVIEALGLRKHPREGGYFLETYRSGTVVPGEYLPPGFKEGRDLSTAIYYMLTPGTFSEMHRLTGDELFHFYLGGAVEMLQLFPGGGGKKVILGSDISGGMLPQCLVPAGVWQGSRLLEGNYALMGTTMAPGFDYGDYESGDRRDLIKRYPDFEALITILTRV